MTKLAEWSSILSQTGKIIHEVFCICRCSPGWRGRDWQSDLVVLGGDPRQWNTCMFLQQITLPANAAVGPSVDSMVTQAVEEGNTYFNRSFLSLGEKKPTAQAQYLAAATHCLPRVAITAKTSQLDRDGAPPRKKKVGYSKAS